MPPEHGGVSHADGDMGLWGGGGPVEGGAVGTATPAGPTGGPGSPQALNPPPPLPSILRTRHGPAGVRACLEGVARSTSQRGQGGGGGAKSISRWRVSFWGGGVQTKMSWRSPLTSQYSR